MTTSPTTDTGPSTDRRFFGHPLALGSLFSVELWERFSFSALSGTLAGFYSPENEGAYFGITGAAAIVLGLALCALSPWTRRAMRGVR